MLSADPRKVSARAKKRGLPQVPPLSSGHVSPARNAASLRCCFCQIIPCSCESTEKSGLPQVPPLSDTARVGSPSPFYLDHPLSFPVQILPMQSRPGPVPEADTRVLGCSHEHVTHIMPLAAQSKGVRASRAHLTSTARGLLHVCRRADECRGFEGLMFAGVGLGSGMCKARRWV